jgi:hypothetical protein
MSSRRACHVEHLSRDKQQAPDQPLVALIGGRYDAIVASGMSFHEGLLALPQKLKKGGTQRAGPFGALARPQSECVAIPDQS